MVCGTCGWRIFVVNCGKISTMKLAYIFFCAATCLMSAIDVSSMTVDVVPRPAEFTVSDDGWYELPSDVIIAGEGADGSRMSRQAVKYMRMAGFNAGAARKGGDITVMADPNMTDGQYALSVRGDGVKISCKGDRGLYYAIQTLRQLSGQGDRRLPLCEINDYPRHGYRGLMLDVVRCYVPVEELKRFVDVASQLKINNVHLHLTDDNGWRLQIKKYPKLTDVGAWRVERDELFPGRLNQRDSSEPTPVGGYYTQKEMRELVKYAAERHVNIIPEIEMPAHAVAAIASYPELACPVNDKFVGVFPGIGGKDASIIMCAGNDRVYEFYEDVLDEVMDIFPSEYINLGGDEADKRMWEQCTLCQQRIAEEGLKDCEELQAYFMDRINHYVRSHGRTAMGWDEVTYGDPKEDMVILGWQGDGMIAANDSRKSGRKFIMTPAKTTYLIRYQGPQWFEPWTYFGNNKLSDIYNYEPVGADWTEEMEKNLLGVQGSLWSEFCKSAADMQYLVFPRLLAVADIGWRRKGEGDYVSFLRGVDNFVAHLDSMGINNARSMWNIQHTIEPTGNGEVTVRLECERPDAEIRYSIGDTTFTLPYAPITLREDAMVYASTFKNGKKMGRTLVLPVRFDKATGRKVTSDDCRNGLASRLTNGLRGSLRNSDFEWAGWWNANGGFTVDLGEVEQIKSVKLGTLINSDICVVAPYRVLLYTSDDGQTYRLSGDVAIDRDKGLSHPAQVLDIDFGPLDVDRARFLKVVAINPGDIPDGMAREGSHTWIYFDELMVE